MFPFFNCHYHNQYKVGYQGTSFVNETEYKHQYLKYPTRAYTGQGGSLDVVRLNNKVTPTKNNKYDQKYDYFTPKKDPIPKCNDPPGQKSKELLNSYKESLHNHEFPEPKKEQVEGGVCKEEKEMKKETVSPKYELKKIPYANKEMFSKTPVNKNLRIEMKEKATSPKEKITLPSGMNTEHLEKSIRTKKYKQYLDLQIKLQNEKLENERQNRLRTNELYKRRAEELQNLERELMIMNQLHKGKLANEYERQIAEKKEARSRNLASEGENNFSDLLEINRRRYFQVILLRILAHR